MLPAINEENNVGNEIRKRLEGLPPVSNFVQKEIPKPQEIFLHKMRFVVLLCCCCAACCCAVVVLCAVLYVAVPCCCVAVLVYCCVGVLLCCCVVMLLRWLNVFA